MLQTSTEQPRAKLSERSVKIVVQREQSGGGFLESMVNRLSSVANLELHVVESGLSSGPANNSLQVIRPAFRLSDRQEHSESARSEHAQSLWFKCGPGSIHERLIRYSDRIDASLVVIEDGRGTKPSWWRPSAAERMSARVPVLSVPAGVKAEFDNSRGFRWLVVLDGSVYAEAVLRPLSRIARWLPSEITLIQPLEYAQLWRRRVVSNESAAMWGLGVSIADSEDYLRRVATQLGAGVPVRTCCVSERDSLSTVMRMIDSEAVDAVAIGLSRQAKVMRRIECEFNEVISGKLRKPHLFATVGCKE